jgi:hypothetical protein
MPRCLPAVLALLLAACSPTLDWRDARPEGSGASLLLPCRPNAQTRSVQLAGRAVRLTLHACSAGDVTWALAFADVADPAVVSAALDELRQSAAANLGAATAQTLALAVPGATPNAASTRVLVSGRLPDGTAVQEQVAVFTRGTVVFQATVIGPQLPGDGVETFFGALRTGP